MKINIFIFLSIFCLTNIWSQTYRFASIENLPGQSVAGSVLTDIYRNLEIEIEIIPLPSKRATIQASEGIYDGEIARIESYQELNYNLVKVPTPYYFIEVMAFYKVGNSISLNNKEDINRYRVGIIRDVNAVKDYTKNVVKIFEVSEPSSLIKMLKSGRIDIAILSNLNGKIVLDKLRENDNIRVYDTPVFTQHLYHYIHIKNITLVESVDQEINRMRKSAELDELIMNHEEVIINEWSLK